MSNSGAKRLNEANSSNHSTMALSDFHTFFPHEPTPSTSATATSSTGTTVKAASLSPLPSILKRRTSDAGSTRPGLATLVNMYIHKEELEKETGVHSTDEDKKLTCRQSLCEKHRMQQKENSKRGKLAGRKSSPIKSVVRRARSVLKPPNSPSSELVVFSGSEEEYGWGKEI
jgi:hypothetical protein